MKRRAIPFLTILFARWRAFYGLAKEKSYASRPAKSSSKNSDAMDVEHHWLPGVPGQLEDRR